MAHSLRKLVRTLQSELSFLKGMKDELYFHGRRLLAATHEREFHALEHVPDDLPGCYVDVGANQGQSIESILLMKPRARIHSFEANPLLAAKLLERYADRTAIAVHSYGLSDCSGQQTLFVPAYKSFVYDGDASLDPAEATALLSSRRLYGFSQDRVSLDEVPCSTQRLDDQRLHPLFIKLDVQGYELQVVRGGLETIRRHEPILMIECVHDRPELERLLGRLGYEEYLFDRRGFFPGRSTVAVNQILMTPRRAGEVRRAPGSATANTLVSNAA